MKSRISKSLFPILLLTLLFACKKEGDNVFNMFDDVSITYHNNSPYSITGYKEVNDGDSVFIDFTIKSPNRDMYQVWLLETGTENASMKIPITDDSQRREFSHVIKLKADKRAGKTSYRVFPVDKDLVYMGDGHKQVTIDVRPNYTFLTERYAYSPDSQKVKKCFFSLSTGEAFSYSEGKQNEAKIDFVVDTILVPRPNTPNTYEIKTVMYALDAPDSPLYSFYDLSSWNKRNTVFSTAVNAGTTFTNFKTGSQIRAAAEKAKPDKKGPIEIKTGQLVYFKTHEGKYGALKIETITFSHHQNGLYFEFQIKMPG